MNRRQMVAALAVAGLLGAAVAIVAAPATYGTPQLREYPYITEYVDAKVLGVAGTAEAWTVPTGCNFAVFAATASFYASTSGAAAVPGADVSNGSAAMLNPSARRVVPGDSISLVSSTAGAVVTIECYSDGGFDVQ